MSEVSKLERLYSEYVDDFSVNQLSLREKALKTPALKVKWIHMLVTEEKLLKKMEEALEKEIELYNKESFGKKSALYNNTKVGMSDTVAKIKKCIAEQKDVIRFLTLCVEKGISSYNFELKNIIDVLKIENG